MSPASLPRAARASRLRLNWLPALLSAAPAVTLGAALAVVEPPQVRAVKDLAFDAFMTAKPRVYDVATPVRVIDIDEESLARLGQWPWPRTTLARLTTKLADAGAAAIALDILIAEPDRTSIDQVIATMEPSPQRDAIERIWRDGGVANDAALAQAMAARPVVLGFVASPDHGARPPVKAAFAFQGDPAIMFLQPPFRSATSPLPELAAAASGVGALNFAPDRDTIVRRAPTFVRIGDQVAPSLPMEALRVAQGGSTFVIKASNASGASGFGAQTGIVSVRNGDAVVDTEADGAIRVYYAGPQANRRIPAWKALSADFNLAEVRDRILFVGASAAGLRDVRATPLSAETPGVEVHAETVEHILAGARLARPDYARGVEAVAIVGAGLLAVAATVLCSPLIGALAALALAASLVAAAWLFFAHAGLLFDPILPPLAALASFASATIAAYRRTERDKAQIRDAFGRYVSPAVIEALIADPSKLRLGGEIRTVTVLFSDIRNFTQRSEHLPANEVVRFLNAVHTPMSEAVMNLGGVVDKYIGDGLMAFWNAPLDDPDHVRQALRAALQMLAELPRVAADLETNGAPAKAPPLALGIGLHTGLACVGNLGSDTRFDYSIIGDTVNCAARIEPLCKDYGAPILVSEAIVEAAPEFAYLEIGQIALRGRQSMMRIFALCGDEAAAQSDEFQTWKRLHDRALAALRANAPEANERLVECEKSPAAALLKMAYGKWRAGSQRALTDGA